MSAAVKFNIHNFIRTQTQRFKSSVMLNHVDITVRTSTLAMTLGVTDLNFQGISDKFYLPAETINKNG